MKIAFKRREDLIIELALEHQFFGFHVMGLIWLTEDFNYGELTVNNKYLGMMELLNDENMNFMFCNL